MKLISKMFVLSLVVGIAACSNLNKQQRNTAIGATLGGAALGGVIGSQIK